MMRKWQDLAPQDDPDSWHAISNMLPTRRGSYELGYVSAAVNLSATGATTVRYAFAARTLTTSLEYVVTDKIWQYTTGTLTDRTNGVTVGAQNHIMMAQYGNVTIAVMGASNPTVSATGGNFSALAGAPQGEIICVQSNAVLVFNTSTSADGWAASDVGDYTNWSTGEAASGRIIATPGPITAAVSYGNDVFVFKPFSIYRMTYVGGTVKWQIQLVWNGLGTLQTNDVTVTTGKYSVVATAHGVAFEGNLGFSNDGYLPYLFDGASAPRRLNPLTSLGNSLTDSDGGLAVYTYNPIDDILTISPMVGSNATGSRSLYFYYSFPEDAWGSGAGGDGEADGSGVGSGNGVVHSEWQAGALISFQPYSKPTYWAYRGVTNQLTRNQPTRATSGYLQSKKYGRPDGQSTFSRLIPLLRRRSVINGSLSNSAALTFDLYNELEDTAPASTRSVTESTLRKRFDLLGGTASAPFATFKVTWTNLDVEVDDFMVKSTFAQDGS